MKRIAVVMAMMAEASPIITALGADEVIAAPPLALRWFAAARRGVELLIAVNGRDRRFGVDSIGTEPAALNTYVVIDRFDPDILLSVGTAGGWQRSGGEVGDVYVSEGRVVHHDRRVALDGFREYGIGSYPVVNAQAMAVDLGLKTGIVTTSNSLDENNDDRRMIAESGAAVKDMEAAAVAYVCEQMAVPFLALKAITDLVDHSATTADQFTANLDVAATKLSDALIRSIDWLISNEWGKAS